MTYLERIGNLPHSDIVVDWLSIDNREIDGDAVPRRHSDSPHAVLKVWILSWVSRRVNCAIHACYIPTTESCREGKIRDAGFKKKKAFLALPQIVKPTQSHSLIVQ